MWNDFGLTIEGSSLVSCVMVTNGRPDQIACSLKSFLSQTYQSKELIIVSQGSSEDNDKIQQMIYGHKSIEFVEAPKRLSLGGMRNLSVELAQGEIICQWDDDDYYHPNRILTQYKCLRGKHVASLYTQYLKYFADTGRLYLIDHLRGTDDYVKVMNQYPFKKYLCGSVMFRKSCFYEANNLLYPECGNQSDKEEDLNVLQRLMKMGEIAPVNVGYEYCYVYHGGNVYQRRHHELVFHKKYCADAERLLFFRSQIEHLLSIAGVTNPVDICSSPILDFDNPETHLEGTLVFRYEP